MLCYFNYISNLNFKIYEIEMYRMDLVGIRKVRWEDGGCSESGNHTLFYANVYANCRLGTGFFVHRPIRSALRRMDFI